MPDQPQPVALIVDDEPQLVSIIEFALSTQGFTCHCARTGAQAWQLFSTTAIDLVVLDVMLPDISGWELCQRMRAKSGVAILMLTALGTESDRIRGLQGGADDYVTKPFSPRELALRAQAIIRRSRQPGPPPLLWGPVRINPGEGAITIGHTRLSLPDLERQFLTTLVRHQGAVVSLRALANEVWGLSLDESLRHTIKTTVYRLRKHLEEAGIDPGLIVSHRGAGYSLATPPA